MKLPIAAKLALLLCAVAVVPMAMAFGLAAFVLTGASEEASSQAREVARSALETSVRREALGLVRTLGEQAKNGIVTHDFALLRDAIDHARSSPNLIAVRIYDAGGVLLGDGSDGPALNVQREGDAIRHTLGLRTDEDELTISEPITVAGRSVGFMRANFSLTAARLAQERMSTAVLLRQAQGRNTLKWMSLLAVVLLGGLASVLAVVASRRLTRPIRDLRDATQQVAAGDWNVRLDVRGQDELAQLTAGFNKMAGDLRGAQKALEEQASVAREMEIAERIQTSLLPMAPDHKDFEFAGRMDPAAEVGGDFYDILSKPGENLWITIGDVSSHGLSSGLVMLMAQSSFATLWNSAASTSPDKILRYVNSTIYECVCNRMRDNKYITGLVFCHRGGGTFQYAGAHVWPLVYRASRRTLEQLEVDGAWIGLVPDVPKHPVQQVTLEPGDVLCLYTDGVIEAMNSTGEQYDVGRLETVLRRVLSESDLDLDQARDAVFYDLEEFSAERDDDRTLLLIRRAQSHQVVANA